MYSLVLSIRWSHWQCADKTFCCIYRVTSLVYTLEVAQFSPRRNRRSPPHTGTDSEKHFKLKQKPLRCVCGRSWGPPCPTRAIGVHVLNQEKAAYLDWRIHQGVEKMELGEASSIALRLTITNSRQGLKCNYKLLRHWTTLIMLVVLERLMNICQSLWLVKGDIPMELGVSQSHWALHDVELKEYPWQPWTSSTDHLSWECPEMLLGEGDLACTNHPVPLVTLA